jgi:tRNA(fMet)-specific endonuclease VapC
MELRLALDASSYVSMVGGDAEIGALVSTATEVWLPFVALAELRGGFRCGSRGVLNEKVLSRFLLKPGIGVLFADGGTLNHYANLFGQLRAQDAKMSTNALWIAALAIQHELKVCTNDPHFAHLPQIARAA